MTNSKLVGDMVVGKAKDIPHRTWKVNAIDGDQTVITVRLDSTLNSEGKFLTPGAVIHVALAFPVYMDYGNLYDMRCAIVLRDFEIIGRRPVPSDLKGPPKRLSVEGYTKIHDRSDKEEPDANAAGECVGKQSKECTGDLCSKHGIAFAVCLARSVPIKNVSIAKVAKECVFVDRELKDMANNHKCFLLYYYYATSVYQFHGKGNRVELPDCIVSAVRRAYPPDEKSKKK